MKYRIPDEWRKRPVLVDLVGVGGTGSRVLPQLAELHVALNCYQHPGLKVYAFDPDRVSESNIGRTAFAPSDIGNHKVSTLVDRVNRQYGLMWRGLPQNYAPGLYRTDWHGAPADILITCTDSIRSRVEFAKGMYLGSVPPPALWLDCGNAESIGQVIIGEPEWAIDLDRSERRARLHTVLEVFPEWEAAAATEEPDPESCTLAIALGRQSLTINRWMATVAFELLWQLFRRGGLDHNVVWVNGESMRTAPEYRATPARTTAREVAREHLGLDDDVSPLEMVKALAGGVR